MLRFYKIFNKHGLNFLVHIFIYSFILFIEYANKDVDIEKTTMIKKTKWMKNV